MKRGIQMSEPNVKAEVRPFTTKEGPVPNATVVGWAADLLQRSIALPVGVGRLIREEVIRAAYGAIDWLEGTSQSSFKVAREAVRQIDQLSREAVDGVEPIIDALAKSIRGSGEAAGEVVSRTAVSLMGAKQA
jgi:hypothetical protein